jgi:hypothetical protein
VVPAAVGAEDEFASFPVVVAGRVVRVLGGGVVVVVVVLGSVGTLVPELVGVVRLLVEVAEATYEQGPVSIYGGKSAEADREPRAHRKQLDTPSFQALQ